jgi:hypothetical protein
MRKGFIAMTLPFSAFGNVSLTAQASASAKLQGTVTGNTGGVIPHTGLRTLVGGLS